MRSAKRYTNTTFTKRVDHHGGEHRSDRAAAEPLVCRECGAVYERRRWIAGSTPRARLAALSAQPTLCPACEMKAKGLARGFLTLEGSFLADHRAEIVGLLRGEEERAVADNPTGRILEWDSSVEGTLTLRTSTEHLAQRLGHALHKAYSGDVSYDFSHENKLARVTWTRNE
jgi:hypothetical protein